MNLGNVFLFFAVILSCLAVNVVAHEATHLLLYDEAQGVCFGFCNGVKGNFSEFWGAASYGIGRERQNEVLPTLVGFAAMVGWMGLGTFYFRKQTV